MGGASALPAPLPSPRARPPLPSPCPLRPTHPHPPPPRSRCGKTQLAATLAVTAQLERSAGGASGKVIILDTENAFRIERVAEIAEKRFGLDPAAVLDNITFARCLQHEHQQELVVQGECR